MVHLHIESKITTVSPGAASRRDATADGDVGPHGWGTL